MIICSICIWYGIRYITHISYIPRSSCVALFSGRLGCWLLFEISVRKVVLAQKAFFCSLPTFSLFSFHATLPCYTCNIIHSYFSWISIVGRWQNEMMQWQVAPNRQGPSPPTVNRLCRVTDRLFGLPFLRLSWFVCAMCTFYAKVRAYKNFQSSFKKLQNDYENHQTPTNPKN